MSGEPEQKIHILGEGDLTDQLVEILKKDTSNEVHVELNGREAIWRSTLVEYLNQKGFCGSVRPYKEGGKTYLELKKL